MDNKVKKTVTLKKSEIIIPDFYKNSGRSENNIESPELEFDKVYIVVCERPEGYYLIDGRSRMKSIPGEKVNAYVIDIDAGMEFDAHIAIQERYSSIRPNATEKYLSGIEKITKIELENDTKQLTSDDIDIDEEAGFEQIILYYDEDNFNDFMNITDRLREKYGVTDNSLLILRLLNEDN